MGELETRLDEMRKDVATWNEVSDAMGKAAQSVTGLKDLRTAFGYLGYKAGVHTAYATLNDTLKSLAEQADTTFEDVEAKLRAVISAYDSTETANKDLISKIKEGWNF